MSRGFGTADGRLAEVDPRTHTAREQGGRFRKVTRCDGCGKPVTGQHFTNDRVCEGGDGPGFYLCDRARCVAAQEKIEAEGGLEALRAYYTETRGWKNNVLE